MRIILKVYKSRAHTWHSAFLRKRHCCLPSTSGTAYQERHLQCYFYAPQLVHLSEERIGLLAFSPTQALHVCIGNSCGVWDITTSRLAFKGSLLPGWLSSWLPPRVLRYLAFAFVGQQSDSKIMISWFEWNLRCSSVCFNRAAWNVRFSFPHPSLFSASVEDCFLHGRLLITEPGPRWK